MNSLSELATTALPFQYPNVRDCDQSRASLPWQAEEGVLAAESREQLLAKARAEGETKARECFDQELREIRTSLGTAIYEFTQHRAQYLRALESEAVKLSLAIARRVLRRESQVDTSLLLGLVRSSLSELSETSHVRLCVHPAVLEDWKRHFQQTLPEHAPELRPDPKLRGHECRIESSIGSTILSLESRLAEIEHGLFDLLSTSILADASEPRHLQ